VSGRLENQSGNRNVRRHHRVVVHHQRTVRRDQFDESGVTRRLQGSLQLPDAGIDARVDRLAVLSDQGTVAGGRMRERCARLGLDHLRHGHDGDAGACEGLAHLDRQADGAGRVAVQADGVGVEVEVLAVRASHGAPARGGGSAR